jgi:hypothetical protein
MEKIIVGSSEYPLVKKGRAQAEQVEELLQWLGRYGGKFFDAMTNEEGEVEISTSLPVLIGDIANIVTADALIELYVVVTGCTEEEAEEHFDVAQLIDVTVVVFEKQKSFKKVVNRFFSKRSSTNPMEELSTKSEKPMDGQTEK